MIPLLLYNGVIIHSGMVFGARGKNKNETSPPPLLPILPHLHFTNLFCGNFVTPPVDLIYSEPGANGMRTVRGFNGGGR